ncbi:MAG: TRAP transporter substrate-binding protein [Gammaproteobacteria bacterium]|nr:TRAP transporter substrate-binding protein [Gammaproteobacteria bacterium]
MKKLLLALTACSFVSTGFAGTQWKMAAGYGDDTLQTKTIRYFADQVKDNTGGEIDIEVFPNQSLFKQKAILPATKAGKVELGEVFLSGYDKNHPLWGVDNLPFVANSFEKAEQLWKISRQAIAEDLEKMDLVLLYAVPWPGQNIYSKEAIESGSDLVDKKFRSYNDTTAKVASLLGGEPKEVEYSDISKEFSNGELDVMMTSSTGGVNSEAWNYAKYYTKIDASFPKNIVFINKATWEGLDDVVKQSIMESAAKAEQYGWELSKKEQESNESVLAEKGVAISEPSQELQQLLFRTGQKLDIEWRKNADERSLEIMREFRGY